MCARPLGRTTTGCDFRLMPGGLRQDRNVKKRLDTPLPSSPSKNKKSAGGGYRSHGDHGRERRHAPLHRSSHGTGSATLQRGGPCGVGLLSPRFSAGAARVCTGKAKVPRSVPDARSRAELLAGGAAPEHALKSLKGRARLRGPMFLGSFAPKPISPSKNLEISGLDPSRLLFLRCFPPDKGRPSNSRAGILN